MILEQIYDKPLAQASYAVKSKDEIMLVDPGRDPQPYLDFAQKHGGQIVAVFETHPHADFTSSHKEFLERFGAKIYINPKAGVAYEFEALEHGDEVQIGDLTIKALFTPGHSPDHNSYLLIDDNQKEIAVFTGDSLFIGDVGRPDLREGVGHIQLDQTKLAGMMYDTIHEVFAHLDDDVIVYPAHGAGSLCGKNLSDELSDSLGEQKSVNWAFQIRNKEKFVETFLEGQPFIPKYFPHSVELNRQGLDPMAQSVDAVPRIIYKDGLEKGIPIVDSRDQESFKKGHIPNAINIQSQGDSKFETWLGSIVDPGTPFYLVAQDEDTLTEAINRTARIGYEAYIKGALVSPSTGLVQSEKLPLEDIKDNPDQFTIIDIRNTPEVEGHAIFESAKHIPLPELKTRLNEIPLDKPIVIHCAGGYRSAIGSSILEGELHGKTPTYDLSEHINDF